MNFDPVQSRLEPRPFVFSNSPLRRSACAPRCPTPPQPDQRRYHVHVCDIARKKIDSGFWSRVEILQ